MSIPYPDNRFRAVTRARGGLAPISPVCPVWNVRIGELLNDWAALFLPGATGSESRATLSVFSRAFLSRSARFHDVRRSISRDFPDDDDDLSCPSLKSN